MNNDQLFDLHRNKWLHPGELEEKVIQPHIEKHRQLDAMLPQASFFYAVVNFTTYQYDFLGKGQQLLTGFDNSYVQKEGVRFQMSKIHPEDGQIILTKAYESFHQCIYQNPEEALKIVLQSNYRFRHKDEHWLHIMERVWPLKIDNKGKPLVALVQINELPALEPFRMNISLKKLTASDTYSEVRTESFPGMDVQKLSSRETEVLTLITRGLNSKEIAQQLCLSYHTVRTHRKNILRKLGLTTSNELVAYAFTHNLV